MSGEELAQDSINKVLSQEEESLELNKPGQNWNQPEDTFVVKFGEEGFASPTKDIVCYCPWSRHAKYYYPKVNY